VNVLSEVSKTCRVAPFSANGNCSCEVVLHILSQPCSLASSFGMFVAALAFIIQCGRKVAVHL
jgi:hypothetical protein